MPVSPDLTAEEQAVIEEQIRQLEQTAKILPKMRLFLIAAVLITGFFGFRNIAYFMKVVNTDYSVTKRFDGATTLPDMPADQWHIAELRRTSALLQVEVRLQNLATQIGVTGVLLVVLSVYLASLLVKCRKDGPRKALLARLARWQLQQWSPPSKRAEQTS